MHNPTGCLANYIVKYTSDTKEQWFDSSTMVGAMVGAMVDAMIDATVEELRQ